nr:unnamed protein product [Callosobruchus chinensis]
MDYKNLGYDLELSNSIFKTHPEDVALLYRRDKLSVTFQSSAASSNSRKTDLQCLYFDTPHNVSQAYIISEDLDYN